MQREVEKERGEKPSPAQQKRDNQRKLSLPILAWCEAIGNDDLEAMEILFFSKHLVNRKSMHDSKQNIRICKALQGYRSFLEKTMKSYPKSESDIAGYKAFVAKCIMINMIERRYRIVLPGRIAEYALDHGCAPDAYNKDLFLVHFGQDLDDTMILLSNNKQLDKNGMRSYQRTHYALGAVGYESIVESIFKPCDSEKTDWLLNRGMLHRTAIFNLSDILGACQFIRHTWRDVDFKEAADFFYDDYPILYELMDLDVPEIEEKELTTEEEIQMEKRAQTYYDYYHAYYVRLLKDESTQYKRLIEGMRK